MAYDFYLDGVLLPVPPSKLQIKGSNRNTTITLINDGEINLLKSEGLGTVEFEILLPQQKYGFAKYENGFVSADEFLGKIGKLKSDKTPFRFEVIRALPNGVPLFNTDILVSLEDYTISESAEESFDIKVNIELKQYKPYGTKKLELQTDSSGNVTASVIENRNAKTPAESYTVKQGDTLWSICKKQLGDGSKCYEIAKSNNITDPNLINVGQVIRFE